MLRRAMEESGLWPPWSRIFKGLVWIALAIRCAGRRSFPPQVRLSRADTFALGKLRFIALLAALESRSTAR